MKMLLQGQCILLNGFYSNPPIFQILKLRPLSRVCLAPRRAVVGVASV